MVTQGGRHVVQTVGRLELGNLKMHMISHCLLTP